MKLYDENCWDFVKTQDRNPMIFPIEEAIKAHSLHRSLSVKIDNQSTTRISVKGVDLTSLTFGKNVRSQTGSPRQATSLSTRKACVRLWDHSTLTPKVFLYRRGYWFEAFNFRNCLSKKSVCGYRLQVVLGRIDRAQCFDVKVGPRPYQSLIDAHCSRDDPSNRTICNRERYTEFAHTREWEKRVDSPIDDTLRDFK